VAAGREAASRDFPCGFLPHTGPKRTLDLAPPPYVKMFLLSHAVHQGCEKNSQPGERTMLARDDCPRVDRATSLVLLVATLLATPSSLWAQAQWMSNGVPVCILPQCGGRLPMICSDGDRGALIAWQTDRDGNEDIYLQRVLANGTLAPGWPAIGTAATRAARDQYVAGLAPDGQGGALLVWWDWPNYDIYAQHVLGNGAIAPGWPASGLPVSVKAGFQYRPRVLADGAGGAFVAWEDGVSETLGDIYALRVNGDGTLAAGWPAGGLAVCTDPSDQGGAYLASDGAGGIFIGWGDLRNGNGASIFATRVAASGGLVAGWPVNGEQIIGGPLGHGIRGMVPDGAGGVYIGWEQGLTSNYSQEDVYAQRILADGSIAPGWPAAGVPVAAPRGTQFLYGVVTDGAGGLALGWSDQDQQPGVAYAQRLRPDATIAAGWPGSGARVSDLAGWQDMYALAPDDHGGVYAAFDVLPGAGQHGYIQHLTANGALTPGWPSSGVSLVVPSIFYAFQQTDFAITSDGAGGAIVAWNDTRVSNGVANQNQIYAQRYFGDGPTPALVSLSSAEALPDRVALTWYEPARTLAGATVYRRRDGEDWAALGSATFDGTGRLRYEDRNVAPGARYAYRLGWTESAAERFSAESWVDVPMALTLTLEGARPNPAVGPLTVAFTLPRAEPATLELLDVSGRQVLAREVGDLGPGSHVLRLGECGCTPPGMYWLRLAQAGRSLVKRAVLMR